MPNETQGAALAPIQIAEGVFARVNKVVVDCDLVDESGAPIEAAVLRSRQIP